MVDTSRCAGCGRAFAGMSSKPRWVRDDAGQVVGAAHASCLAALRERHIHEVRPITCPIEGARFEAWYEAHYDIRGVDIVDLLAAILIGGEPPTAGLTARQRRLVRHWRNAGNAHRDHAVEAWGRYRQLVREYADWRATREGEGTDLLPREG